MLHLLVCREITIFLTKLHNNNNKINITFLHDGDKFVIFLASFKEKVSAKGECKMSASQVKRKCSPRKKLLGQISIKKNFILSTCSNEGEGSGSSPGGDDVEKITKPRTEKHG